MRGGRRERGDEERRLKREREREKREKKRGRRKEIFLTGVLTGVSLFFTRVHNQQACCLKLSHH